MVGVVRMGGPVHYQVGNGGRAVGGEVFALMPLPGLQVGPQPLAVACQGPPQAEFGGHVDEDPVCHDVAPAAARHGYSVQYEHVRWFDDLPIRIEPLLGPIVCPVASGLPISQWVDHPPAQPIVESGRVFPPVVQIVGVQNGGVASVPERSAEALGESRLSGTGWPVHADQYGPAQRCWTFHNGLC